MAASKGMTSHALGIEEITSGLNRAILADDSAAKKAEKGKGRQKNKDEEAIDALGAAWSNCSLEDDEEAKAQREAERLQEQIQKEKEDKKRAFQIAEAKRESEEYNALLRQFQEHGAKAHEIKRKQRKEEAARQHRLSAEAEASVLAERRAQEERRMQEEALAAQAKQEADDRVRLELLQVYERNLAESQAIALAQANAREAHWQQQRYEAEQIAQYEVVARQAYFTELQQRQQEELFLQQQLTEQHRAYPQGEQVSENIGEVTFEEMDTAPETEASDVVEMDWEQVGETTPLLADPLIPSSLSMQSPTPHPAEPSKERPMEANGTLATEAPAATAAAVAAGVPELARTEPAVAEQVTAAPAIPEPVSEAPVTAALAAPATVLRLSPRETTPQIPHAATPSPPLTPVPAPPPSNQKTTKAVCKRATRNPSLAISRPTISVWSPLGRLLSQQESIPNAALQQVLGKRAREESEDGGPDNKKAKLDGELHLEVGGKRKRETEVFPGNKRVMLGRILGRALAVPGSRFAASPLLASSPTLVPTSTSPNAPLSPPHPLPSSTLLPTPSPPPPSASQPLPKNPHCGLAEAIELYNDLPTLRAEIEWMRTQRKLKVSQKETRGKKSPIDKTIKCTATPASYWKKYREKPSR